ncbi:hypothetical protein DFH11DRAFT_1549949 [Phellopilus nigrolimitatus]|nr:hypothetical protein DFH11DRAFT_1549949 [Phellopilus nigrolimitatus]
MKWTPTVRAEKSASLRRGVPAVEDLESSFQLLRRECVPVPCATSNMACADFTRMLETASEMRSFDKKGERTSASTTSLPQPLAGTRLCVFGVVLRLPAHYTGFLDVWTYDRVKQVLQRTARDVKAANGPTLNGPSTAQILSGSLTSTIHPRLDPDHHASEAAEWLSTTLYLQFIVMSLSRSCGTVPSALSSAPPPTLPAHSGEDKMTSSRLEWPVLRFEGAETEAEPGLVGRWPYVVTGLNISACSYVLDGAGSRVEEFGDTFQFLVQLGASACTARHLARVRLENQVSGRHGSAKLHSALPLSGLARRLCLNPWFQSCEGALERDVQAAMRRLHAKRSCCCSNTQKPLRSQAIDARHLPRFQFHDGAGNDTIWGLGSLRGSLEVVCLAFAANKCSCCCRRRRRLVAPLTSPGSYKQHTTSATRAMRSRDVMLHNPLAKMTHFSASSSFRVGMSETGIRVKRRDVFAKSLNIRFYASFLDSPMRKPVQPQINAFVLQRTASLDMRSTQYGYPGGRILEATKIRSINGAPT